MSAIVSALGFTSNTVTLLCCQLPWAPSSAGKILTGVFFVLSIILASYINSVPFLVQNINENDATFADTAKGYYACMRAFLFIFIYHILLSLALIGTGPGKLEKGGRAILHTGMWPVKGIVLVGGCLLSCRIPQTIMNYSYHIALMSASLFAVFQAIILIDLACNISEYLVTKYEETGGGGYQAILFTLTGVGFVFLFSGSIFLFYYFSQDLDRFIISLNLIMALIVSGICTVEKVREANPSASILPASILSGLNILILFSAFATKNSSVEEIPVWMTYFVAFFRYFFGSISLLAITLKDISYNDSKDEESDLGTQAASTNTETKKDTIIVPLNTTSGNRSEFDEATENSGYSYSAIHFIYALATWYFALIIYNWQGCEIVKATVNASSDTAAGSSIPTLEKPTIKLIKSDFAFWYLFSTICVQDALYLWTLLAPVFLPDRQF